ncbi:MAG: metallophosphoesterase, partial [Sideroxyarcus sp.]|nr:metallophosphoesterase [Sideroxyarcus sp.]
MGFFSDVHTEFLRPSILLTPKDRRMGRIYSLEDFAAELAEAYKDMDVIVAAGDVGSGENAVGFLRMAFPEKPVIFTPGNHEFWGGELFSTHNKMQAACEGTNIHYLPAGEVVEIEGAGSPLAARSCRAASQGVRFCGATLWTDYLLTDSAYAMTSAENLMNDFRRIRIRRLSASGINGAYSHLKPQQLLGFHRQHLLRIKSE